MTVYGPGSKVLIDGGLVQEPILAIVTGICIGQNEAVTYRCEWWNVRERNSEWFEAHRVEPEETKPLRIGFQ